MFENKRVRTKQKALIKDARGRRITQLDPFQLRLLRKHDVIEAETLWLITEELGTGLSRGGVRLAYIFIAALILQTIVILSRMVDLSMPERAGELLDLNNLLILQIWPWVMLIWFGAKRVRFRRIRRVMLNHGRCPHCGYSLKGLRVDPTDEATLCPECGCAWGLGSSRRSSSRNAASAADSTVDGTEAPASGGRGPLIEVVAVEREEPTRVIAD